ncbi:hypothetical protein Gohar_008714, partial [Gossypium harknessii]|nr:hypothetical protein [Gossypium harknessii]
MYKKSLLRAIGSIIGQVVKIGYHTDSGSRGRFARLAVTVDVLKPLVSKVLINGKLQQVGYESLPNICYECGCY